LSEVSDADLLADLRNKIVTEIQTICKKKPEVAEKCKQMGRDLIQSVKGEMSFLVLDRKDEVNFWKLADDYDRL